MTCYVWGSNPDRKIQRSAGVVEALATMLKDKGLASAPGPKLEHCTSSKLAGGAGQLEDKWTRIGGISGSRARLYICVNPGVNSISSYGTICSASFMEVEILYRF